MSGFDWNQQRKISGSYKSGGKHNPYKDTNSLCSIKVIVWHDSERKTHGNPNNGIIFTHLPCSENST